MKSKTSCFNKTIFKKNVMQFWPLWSVYLCYLLVLIPVNIWLSMNQRSVQSYRAEMFLNHGYRIICSVMRDCMLEPFSIFLVAMIMALAVFSYLYTARTANMMHALPVKRLELFCTNYLSGFLFLIVPQVITFVVSVLVCLSNGVICIQYLLYGFLYMAGMSFFAYSLAVFVMMFTGQLVVMPFYYVIINFLYVGCLYIISKVIELMNYGVNSFWYPGKACILSPIYYLSDNLVAQVVYDNEVAQKIEMTGGHLIAIYAVAAIGFVVAAYLLYKHRRIETAGDVISVRIIKPVFRWGVALCVGFAGATFTAEILLEYYAVDIYVCMLIASVVFGALGFFAAEMLLMKSFRVFRKRKIVECAGAAVALVALISVFELDVFGIEGWVPKAEEVDKAFVYMDYPFDVSEEELPELLELHQEIIDNEEEYLENYENGNSYCYTTFRYYLKDGSIVERRYPLPLTEEYAKDTSTPAGKLLEWESVPERLLTEILGIDYKKNEYYSGNIDLYNSDGKVNNYMLDRTEIELLISAIKRDVKEGNFDRYYIGALLYNEDMGEYYNNIYFDYVRRDGTYYDTWDYFDSYTVSANAAQVVTEERASSYSMSNYITFGPECKYTVAALRDLGIIDDTWGLYTCEEYRQFED